MPIQQPAANTAISSSLPESERRFLDNEASRPFRGSSRKAPRRGLVYQHTYVPTSSDALDHPPPATEDWIQRDSSLAALTEPWPEPPQVQLFGGKFFLPVEASDRSSETIASESQSDRPLVQLILDTPEKNIVRVDGRHRTPIPIISGAHASVALDPDQRVGIDTSSLLVLSHLFLVRKVFHTFQDIILAPDIKSQLQWNIDRVSAADPVLGEQIEEIASDVAKSVKAGTASILGRSTSDTSLQQSEFNRKSEDTLILMASKCDVVCIDDPRYNCRKSLGGDEGHKVQVACIVDLLRALMQADTITEHDYWLARHKLREYGFTVIIPDAEELHYWLKASFKETEGMRESVELRTIRHSIAHLAQCCELNTGETTGMLQASADVCSEAINKLWVDETISIQEAILGSDWIWNHASPLRYLGGLSLTSNLTRMAAVRALAYFFIPQDRMEDQGAGYNGWIEDSVVPIFQCANSSVVDESLELIADSILHGQQFDNAYGHNFMKQLPSSLANRLLERRPKLGDKWGFKMGRLVTFDSGPSISIMDLIGNARRAYTENRDIPFIDVAGRQGFVALDQESKSVSVRWTEECGAQRAMPMFHLMLLCPSTDSRVNTAESIVQFLGATVGDKRQLLHDLVSRTATDEEMSQISNELSNGMKALQERLHGKIIYHMNIDLDDVLPSSMKYFERLVGPRPSDSDPDNFIQEVIVPYRKELIKLDLRSGLEIACLGFLSDSLAPGEWVKDYSNDEVWEALSGFDYSATPFVLLAALDVALYRQGDVRFQELAKKAVNVLYDPSFGRSDSLNAYEAFHVVMELVENRINTLDSGAVQLGYWKRMAAWMQAALFVGYLAKDASSENMASLRDFGTSNMTVAGRYARIAGARVEPLAFASRTTVDLLHTHLVERLVLLRWRHERLAHDVPEPEVAHPMAVIPGASDEADILGIPGPLDGHRVPTKQVPPELVKSHLAGADPDSEAFPWQTYVTLSQTYELDTCQRKVFRAAVRRLLSNDANVGSADLMRYADYSSIVAAACRDGALADAVADLIARGAAVAHEPRQLAQMIGCLLQTAAAHSDQNAWSEWIEESLAQVALQLPPPPSESSRVFADLLDELGSVLPVESWVHLRARAICACIAPTAPPLRADVIEEGWLDDALEALEGIRAEALELGFVAPGETAIRSAREFLESLARLIRQTPDVQPLQDGEIAIDFYNQTERGGVLFVVEIDGSGACYTVANGVSESFTRSSYKDLLDGEIRDAVTSAGIG